MARLRLNMIFVELLPNLIQEQSGRAQYCLDSALDDLNECALSSTHFGIATRQILMFREPMAMRYDFHPVVWPLQGSNGS